jgi:hypothetical protein
MFCVGVWLVCQIEEGTKAEGVQEQSAEKDIWA